MSRQAEFEIVRDAVLLQHESILKILDACEGSALRGSGPAGSVDRQTGDLIEKLCSTFERHLDFEEAELLPYVCHADAWGADRIGELLDEHDLQRAETAQLMHALVHGEQSSTVVARLQTLVASLRDDIRREEAWLARLSGVVRAEPEPALAG